MFYCHLCHPEGRPIEDEDMFEHMEEIHDIHPVEIEDAPVYDLTPDDTDNRFAPGDII